MYNKYQKCLGNLFFVKKLYCSVFRLSDWLNEGQTSSKGSFSLRDKITTNIRFRRWNQWRWPGSSCGSWRWASRTTSTTSQADRSRTWTIFTLYNGLSFLIKGCSLIQCTSIVRSHVAKTGLIRCKQKAEGDQWRNKTAKHVVYIISVRTPKWGTY